MKMFERVVNTDRFRTTQLGGARHDILRHFSGRIRHSPSMNRKADMQYSRLFILAFSLCAICCRTAQPSECVFFAFDDHSIPWQHNLKLTLVSATKHPDNPVLRRGPEGAPDHGHACLYGTVIKEGSKFRMWYLGMFETHLSGGHGGTGYWRPMCYAESTDGVHWTKPELGLDEFNGSKNNNICLIKGEPFSLTRVNDFLSVLHDPSDPDPAKRYKVAYIAHVPYDNIKGGMSKLGKKEKRIGSTICATSADGLTWNVVGDRPANAGGERFEVSGLYRFGDFYYTTGQLLSPWAWRADGSDIDRSMWAYRSSDFKTWSQAKAFAFARPGQLANPPIPDQRTHMGAGLWNRGNVLVGLYGIWQNAEVPPAKGEPFCKGVHIDLGLIISNDGIHFREPVAGFKVIARGKEGEWDDIALIQGHAFVNEVDKTMIWYSHWNTGGKPKDRDVGMDIGLATLRRDGLGYLSRKQDDNDAEFITSTFTTGWMSINVDGITPEVPLTADLLDHLDRPIAGYVASITQNGTQQPLIWPKALPAGQKLALRVKFPSNSSARVYAIYLND